MNISDCYRNTSIEEEVCWKGRSGIGYKSRFNASHLMGSGYSKSYCEKTTGGEGTAVGRSGRVRRPAFLLIGDDATATVQCS